MISVGASASATGTITVDPITNDDLQYVRDLGLVTEHGPIAIANLIYRELISQTLANRNKVGDIVARAVAKHLVSGNEAANALVDAAAAETRQCDKARSVCPCS